jgi:hypothetical protein
VVNFGPGGRDSSSESSVVRGARRYVDKLPTSPHNHHEPYIAVVFGFYFYSWQPWDYQKYLNFIVT